MGMLSLELLLVATGSPQLELEQQSLAVNASARPFLLLAEKRNSGSVLQGSSGRTRTYNQPVNSRPLCRLSYRGIPNCRAHYTCPT